MDKEQQKTISIGLIMGGVLAVVLPIFINSPIMDTLAKPIGYLLLFCGILYMIAGEQINKIAMNLFDKKKAEQLKNMTPEQLIEYERKKQEMKMQKLNDELEIAKKKAEIQKIHQATAELKKGSSIDVLGNIEGFIKTKEPDKKKKDPMDNLKDLF